MRAFPLVIGLLLVCGVAHSETDVLMRAVGFALTGRDDAEPKAIDRANCVFAYQDDVFYLNNVQTDRIKIQEQFGGVINVDLHGDDIVVEHGVVSTDPTDQSAKTHRENRKEYHLILKTDELDRMKRRGDTFTVTGALERNVRFKDFKAHPTSALHIAPAAASLDAPSRVSL